MASDPTGTAGPAAPATKPPGYVGRHGAWKRGQPQSYLMKARYRTANLPGYLALGSLGALGLFAKARWGEGWESAKPCPHCGTISKHYPLKGTWRWRCSAKNCRKDFTLFTKTPFHAIKIEPVKLLGILAQFVEAKDSVSAREIGGLYNMRQQAAHVLIMKVREALAVSMLAEPPLAGRIQADAAYFIKYKRPENKGTKTSAKTRSESRSAGVPELETTGQVHHPDMQALIVFAQMAPQGHRRYRLKMVKTEFEVDMAALAMEFCTPHSVLISDQHSAYIPVGAVLSHEVVNHGAEFKSKDGLDTNHAENFFSRMRHSQAGAWHRMSVRYLAMYGWEMAWRQSMTGHPNGDQMTDLLRRLFRSPRSVEFADYWRKRKNPSASGVVPAENYPITEYPKSKVPKRQGRPPKVPRLAVVVVQKPDTTASGG